MLVVLREVLMKRSCISYLLTTWEMYSVSPYGSSSDLVFTFLQRTFSSQWRKFLYFSLKTSLSTKKF